MVTTPEAVRRVAEITTAEDLFDEMLAANAQIGKVPLIDSLQAFVKLATVATARVKMLEAGR